jgi:inosine guanosine and xanthosine phosphorylase family
MKLNVLQKIEKTKKYILSKTGFKPSVAIIAGSGLGNLKKQFTNIKTIKYRQIPYFSKTTVDGHAGELVLCSYKGTQLLLFNGRFHFYEGYCAQDVIYPVKVMKAMGVETLVLTAAVGGMNKKYNSGDIVILKDHINFTGNNPLIGENVSALGERFPGVADVYDAPLRKNALKAAVKLKIKVHEGIYFGVTGPSYETAAEVNAFRKLGGDVVGMSVVYEAIAAAHMKMKVVGISYVSNMAAGINKTRLNHKEVLEAGKKANSGVTKIIKTVLEDSY